MYDELEPVISPRMHFQSATAIFQKISYSEISLVKANGRSGQRDSLKFLYGF